MFRNTDFSSPFVIDRFRSKALAIAIHINIWKNGAQSVPAMRSLVQLRKRWLLDAGHSASIRPVLPECTHITKDQRVSVPDLSC
jgi:hypothetical protein